MRIVERGNLIGTLAALWLAIPIVAQAHPSARLVYTRGEGAASCPDEEALRNQVAGRLGYDPFSPAAERTVIARIVREGRGLRGNVELRNAAGGSAGSRRLVSEQNDCAELAATLALAICIGIDPLLSTRRAPVAVPAAPATTPSAIPPPPPATAVAPPPIAGAERERITLSARIGLLGSIGAAPAPSLGLTAQLEARWRAGSLAVEARVDFPASQITTATGGVQTFIAGAAVVPCLHYRVVAGCALALFGALRAVGLAVDRPLSSTTFYAAAGIRIGVAIPVWRSLFAFGHADLLFPLTPTSLRIDNVEAWSTPPVSASLGTGVGVNFP